ncbi:PadR family transcriptional regulator [Gemmatimonadota bacterium]
MFTPDLKKGSIELLILSLLEHQARHGYEIGKMIRTLSDDRLSFSASSLYPTLYAMEEKGWLKGRWVEKEGQRRRCFYSLTADGRKALEASRSTWREYISAVNAIVEPSNA